MELQQNQGPANISHTLRRNCSERIARLQVTGGAILLSRRRPGCTEFLLMSLWESASFLESLTGADLEGVIARELINLSTVVKNYELLVTHLPSDPCVRAPTT